MTMVICGDCGLPMGLQERHCHIPDFYLKVWDCQASLVRSVMRADGSMYEEQLPFQLPPLWVDWVLETCGGALNRSGIYRLPGMLWEWVLAKCREDVQGARFLEQRIHDYLLRR